MLKRVEGTLLRGRLVYWSDERQIDVEPRYGGGAASLMVNDVQIEVNEDGLWLYLWGYCPRESWAPAALTSPPAEAGRIRFWGEVIPGVSERLNPTRWASVFDESSAWLCIGDPDALGEVVAFGPASIAVLAGGEATAL
jgi:hypothetical protein